MTQKFYDYMQDFLIEKKAKNVVEVGSDIQLKLALNLAPYCRTFFSVNFPEDCRRMRGWYEMHQKMAGIYNIVLKSGNAMKLSEMIPHADIIILQNVLLDLTGEDTALMWKYRRGELEYSEEQWTELGSRFKEAEEQGYKEFLKVANLGYVIRFGRPEPDDKFRNLLTDKLEVDSAHINQKKLLYDETGDVWEAYIIDNTQENA